MTKNTLGKILLGSCILAATAAAQTSTTEAIKGAPKVTTRQETGTVTYVEGNTVVVKMSTGEVRTVTVPDNRTATVDGKEITVHDLQVGTKLTATFTTTTTPVTERTTTNLTGTVWYVAGTTVILTLPDGKNKMYKSLPDFKFDVNGQKATVFDLRKGMRISAEKIVEEPNTVVATNSVITGTAPKPKPVVATPAPAPAPAPVRVAKAAPAPPPPAPVAAAPEPAPEPAPAPARLPKTGSLLPLTGMLGLLFTGAGLGLRRLRR